MQTQPAVKINGRTGRTGKPPIIHTACPILSQKNAAQAQTVTVVETLATWRIGTITAKGRNCSNRFRCARY